MQIVSPQDIDPTVRIANYITSQRGGSWGQRVIPDFELIFVAAGSIRYESREGVTVVNQGQVMTIQPGVDHHLREATGRRTCVLSCIHGELIPGASWGAGDYRLSLQPQLVTDHQDPDLLHDLFRRCSEAFENYGRWRQTLTRTIAKEIWLRLAEHWTQPTDTRLSARTAKMVDYLRQHLKAGVGRQDLAAVFHVTPEHVNYLFRRELGISPTEFVNRERILLAYRLIQEEQLSVKEAAARVGYNDPFYFSRTFKRIVGINPSQI